MYAHRRFPKLVYLVLLSLFSLIASPLPTHAQISLTTIESDATQVARSGVWTAQGAPGASGGIYLYSNGSEADALTLNFAGPSLEVRYISGPSLGTLAIEIDDTVLRTVITTDSQTRYGQVARIDYLTDESHTLRVYAQAGGVIAVDAFLVPLAIDGLPTEVLTNDTGDIQGGAFCSGDPIDGLDRISDSSNGTVITDNQSQISSITPDGRYVVYESFATNLVAGDTNSQRDIFRRDRFTCTNELISQSDDEQLGNGIVFVSRITPDGNLIVFGSAANNLVAGDTNAANDIFLRDVTAGTTSRVSLGVGNVQAGGSSANPSISANGRFVVFQSNATNLIPGDTNAVADIYVRDVLAGTIERISIGAGNVQGNGISSKPDISPDGRYIVFQSDATNLVASDTNGLTDAFLVDRLGLTPIRRISVATAGTQQTGGSVDEVVISANGRFVVFRSGGTNLVASDTNGVDDIFVHDLQTSTTSRVSVASNGTQGNNTAGGRPTISHDGRFVAFQSNATNLVTGDTNNLTDVFVRDRLRNTTVRISVSPTNVQGDSNSTLPSFAANGRYIVFQSSATNFAAGDTNGVNDIFVAPNASLLVGGGPDTLALFNPAFSGVQLINTLTTPPPATANNFFAMTPPATGQWVMGDWDSDGDDTPGVYANGPFFYTNDIGQNTVWRSLWIGVAGAPVSGRFSASFDNDCIGAVQQSVLGGSTVFVLYFTCDLSGTPAPVISSQWLSAVLPDSGGFVGTHQFASGDFNNDRLDSIAVRRGDFIAFGNVAPSVGDATFDLAQFIGNPGTGTSVFVSGDWNNDGTDSFGLYYSNGVFFRRDDLTFNSGLYTQQATTPLIGTGLTAHAWR